jgi:PHD/YefM family antitoxin component YafN of YafNO toxin-antitoxin module
MSPKAQFITDQKGKKTSVILPLAEYEALLEDLDDLAVIAERAKEPTIPLEQVIANLKKDGIL